MTPLQRLCRQYENGCGAVICGRARQRVFWRGSCPCDVAFVGEAPGESEDCEGVPFIGPAGKLLDHIVRNSVPETLTTAFMNLTCCIPRDEDGRKSGQPAAEDIDSCSERLSAQLKLFRPRLIVAVGKLAKDYLEPGFKHSVKREPVRKVDIIHPSHMLSRMNAAMRDNAIKKCVVVIHQAIREVFGAE